MYVLVCSVLLCAMHARVCVCVSACPCVCPYLQLQWLPISPMIHMHKVAWTRQLTRPAHHSLPQPATRAAGPRPAASHVRLHASLREKRLYVRPATGDESADVRTCDHTHMHTQSNTRMYTFPEQFYPHSETGRSVRLRSGVPWQCASVCACVCVCVCVYVCHTCPATPTQQHVCRQSQQK